MSIPTDPPLGASLPRQQTSSPRRRLQRLYSALAVVFLLGVVVQVFLAGAGIFDSVSWLGYHAILGYSLTLIPLLMLILGLVGKLPRSVNWLTTLLLLLVYLQSLFIRIPHGLGVPILSALHPVIALVIFTLPLYLIYNVRLIMRMPIEGDADRD